MILKVGLRETGREGDLVYVYKATLTCDPKQCVTFTAAAAKANSSNNNNKIVIRHPIKIRGHIKNRSITMNVNCKL